jgi:cytochrome P450
MSDVEINGKGPVRYHLPPGHSGWRSFLNSFTFLRDPIRAISKNMKRFSGTYSAVLMGSGRIIITEDPEFIQYVLRDNHSNYQKSELSTKTAARLFGSGLLFSNGQPWLKQRRLIQPGFHHLKIQQLYKIVAHTAREFISDIGEGEGIDIYPMMHKLSFSVLLHSLFNIDLSPQTISELSKGFTDLQDFLLKDINQPVRKLFYPVNKADRKILRQSGKIRNILEEIIDKRRSDPNPHFDLLDMLLNSRYEDSGKAMDPDQIVDEILVLLFAGHETTANTLSWLLYLLADQTAVTGKLRSQIKIKGIFDVPADEYFNAVISEAMRLYPAAWMTERVSLKDDQFKSFSFPKGTIIIPFFFGLHRNGNYWANESSFRPDRFLSEDPERRKKVKNFFPFGAGPRMCIGNNFAMAEMSIILYAILDSFEISPTREVPAMWPLITLRPRKVLLNLKRIKLSSAFN